VFEGVVEDFFAAVDRDYVEFGIAEDATDQGAFDRIVLYDQDHRYIGGRHFSLY
jgi:hypothetical protein